MDACAAHLIEDWKGVVFAEIVDGKTVECLVLVCVFLNLLGLFFNE
jgi:hypothetical protein